MTEIERSYAALLPEGTQVDLKEIRITRDRGHGLTLDFYDYEGRHVYALPKRQVEPLWTLTLLLPPPRQKSE